MDPSTQAPFHPRVSREKREERRIRLIGVRQNNLKNVSVEFPFRKLTVITGLSGSGKSSLAFDTLYAEGQRRYVESLSTYTRQFLEKMPKPDLDGVENVPPAIALEQRNHVVNSRSTVGTQTELVDYLRLMFAKVGQTFCTKCGSEVRDINPTEILDWALRNAPGRKILVLAPIRLLESEPADAPAKKTAKAKKTKATGKAKAPGLPTVESFIEVLKGQGFRRMAWKKSEELEVLDLDEPLAMKQAKFEKAVRDQTLFIVADRMRLSSDVSAETRARLNDTIAQALAAGRGRVSFYDLDQLGEKAWKHFDSRYACLECGTEHRRPEPNLFSFNSPIGACPRCSGFGFNLELDEALVVPDPTKTLKNGAIDPFSKPSFADWQRDLFRFAERQGISIGKRYRDLTDVQKNLLWRGDPKDPTFPGILACFEEMKKWKYKLHIRVFIRRYQSQSLCEDCKGARITKDALAVKIGGLNLPEVLNLPVQESLAWLKGLNLTATQKKTAHEILSQSERRLSFLEEVGVGYLTLARLAKTLSGGEFQRINLATQLGNGLCGTLYILDEPSIGLHAADTHRLIRILARLRDQGNTVVVVEHDLDVMKAADWLVEMGPGAGRRGGELVAQGPASKLIQTPESLTGKYLSGTSRLVRDRAPRPAPRRFIKLTGCRENNLQEIDVEFPLDRLVVVTGMSGSGKSTLVHKTLYQALSKIFNRTNEPIGRYDRLYGAEQISGVVLLDQSPIGRSSRSNPATYLKAWDEVRRIYANQALSLRRGYTPQHFSFNVDGGRCPVCKGDGEITLDMHFMAEVSLPCEECGGKRFKKNILEVSYKGKNVHQLLNTTIDDAFEIFRDHSLLSRKLGILREVGLGYLQLGQSGATLSGGESQRLKIAASLDDREASNLLYIFDEPTTGLHLEDIKKLMQVIQDLVDSRHSVIVIEHHLDVIKQADWVIDVGPGGGKDGGRIVAAGTPEKIAQYEESATGRFLKIDS
ncbi:MAG: excinuclease ABC subunit UvrA [Bdellovibrionales bacterium]|nr:excinuclease ABC subunit UvrA [Bdellovibrionales bacterium]